MGISHQEAMLTPIQVMLDDIEMMNLENTYNKAPELEPNKQVGPDGIL
jgi:hypothetical protein